MAEATAAEGVLSESRLLLATSLWLVTAAAVRVPLLTAVAMHVPLVVYAHTIPRYLYAYATTLSAQISAHICIDSGVVCAQRLMQRL